MTVDITELSDLELLNHITALNNERDDHEEAKDRLLTEMAEAILYAKNNRPGVRMMTIAERLHISRQRAYQIAEMAKENHNANR